MFPFFLLSPSACPQFLFFVASLCPSIYGAAFERMFMSRCLCAIIRQCTITISLYRCPPLRLCNCSLSAKYSFYLHWLGHHSCSLSQFLFAAREQQLPRDKPHIFTFLYMEGCYSTKDNQVTGLVLDILALSYSYFLTQYPGSRYTVVKKEAS